MTDPIETPFSYEKEGKRVIATIRHPKLDPFRAEAIAHFLSNGCKFVPDVENLPPWLIGLDSELQRYVVNEHIGLSNLYMLRIPATATVNGRSFAYLKYLSELKHLSISTTSIFPEDLTSLACLKELEILIFRGDSFTDGHFANLPKLPNIRMMDIQGTRTTEKGVADLQTRYPNVNIYSDFS